MCFLYYYIDFASSLEPLIISLYTFGPWIAEVASNDHSWRSDLIGHPNAMSTIHGLSMEHVQDFIAVTGAPHSRAVQYLGVQLSHAVFS